MAAQSGWEYRTMIFVENDQTTQEYLARGWEVVAKAIVDGEHTQHVADIRPLIQLVLRRPQAIEKPLVRSEITPWPGG